MSLNELGKRANDNAHAKGFYDKDGGNLNIGERIALIHSEVSEALEEWRTGRSLTEVYVMVPDPRGGVSAPLRPVPYDPRNPHHKGLKPEGFPIELADALIRIVDLCAEHGIDLDTAVALKMAYNETRSYRHGGKLA